jgi:aspartate aminotransferase-like enzyme
MAVVREFPEVISIVDTVSSFSVLPIKKDELGIDVLLTGSQKALALPPGMSLFSVSERAMARARTLPDRGYYFDFVEFLANHEKGMTPSTPVIPLIYALRSKLEDIREEGLPRRYARHARLNTEVRQWGYRNGFTLLPEERFGSLSLNCFTNTRGVDLVAVNKLLKSKHRIVIDGGYGKLKGRTFRISNMGDETDESIARLTRALDSVLEELKPAAPASRA